MRRAGAGRRPGGYSAAFRAADLGLKVVIVERYATLGGVCLNVGCIPSKALLHVAAVMDEVSHLADAGVDVWPRPASTSTSCAATRKRSSASSTGGLAAMAKMRKVTIVRGYGQLCRRQPPRSGRNHRHRPGQDRQPRRWWRSSAPSSPPVSQAVRLPFMPEDPRVVDSTGALALQGVPKTMLILGGGIIGLEMGTVYSTLGARLDVVEMMDGLMQGADRDLVKVWQKMNAHALRQHHAQDQDGGRRGHARRHQGELRGGQGRRAQRPNRRPTTWCCRPWAARPTARRSLPTRPAWP